MTAALDIPPDDLACVCRLLEQHAPHPSVVWAFGSRTTGRARTYSDLDLAIDAGRPLSLAEQGKLATAFEEAALPWHVDIVDWVAVSEDFRRLIAAQRIPLLNLGSETTDR